MANWHIDKTTAKKGIEGDFLNTGNFQKCLLEVEI